eukprot:m.53397 g.53397  ORF g.53397 m.53397 type:complete len:151 (-) comp11041_c0_seq3:37-489(-)
MKQPNTHCVCGRFEKVVTAHILPLEYSDMKWWRRAEPSTSPSDSMATVSQSHNVVALSSTPRSNFRVLIVTFCMNNKNQISTHNPSNNSISLNEDDTVNKLFTVHSQIFKMNTVSTFAVVLIQKFYKLKKLHCFAIQQYVNAAHYVQSVL